MAENWLADVRKYEPTADEGVVGAIERYLGIALRNRDSSLVSFSDSTETDRVRENFLKKKLELTDPDNVLDSAIAAVGERMKGDPTKNRVTVYYLLAEQFGKLGVFGGNATGSGLGAAGLVAGTAAAAGAAGAAAYPNASVDAAPTTPVAATTDAPYRNAGTVGGANRFADVTDDDDRGGGGKWWLWLLLALAALALILGLRSCMNQPTATNTSDAATIDNTTVVDTGNMLDGNLTAPIDNATPPAGAAVIAAERAGLPMLKVYFDTGKSAVTNDFSTVAAPIKAYVAEHPGVKLAVSGFNDATGNAAANAALSKDRAKAVQGALTAAGIPADAIVLEKPADTTAGGTNDAEARRVEVTIKQ